MGRRQGKALVDGCERLCSKPPLLKCQSWRAINILATHLSTMFSPAFPSQRSSQNGFALKGAPLLGTARRTAEGEDRSSQQLCGEGKGSLRTTHLEGEH